MSQHDVCWFPKGQKVMFFRDEAIICIILFVKHSSLLWDQDCFKYYAINSYQLLCMTHSLWKKIKQEPWKNLWNDSQVSRATGNSNINPKVENRQLCLVKCKSKWFIGKIKIVLEKKYESRRKGQESATFFKVAEDTVVLIYIRLLFLYARILLSAFKRCLQLNLRENIQIKIHYSGAQLKKHFRFNVKLKVAQLVKNLPAMQETLVWFRGWKDPLEKG